MQNRRKRYLINRKLQFKYLLLVFLAMLVPTLVCGSAIYYLIWQTIAAEIAIPEAIVENLIPALYKVNLILLVALPIVFGVMLLISVYVSHKIAGPMYRLERELDKISSGDYSGRITLRSKDELKEIADKINTLLDRLNSNQ